MAGAGNDLIVVTLDADGDVYNGGDGSDTLDISNASSGVNVDLVSGTISNAETGTDMDTDSMIWQRQRIGGAGGQVQDDAPGLPRHQRNVGARLAFTADGLAGVCGTAGGQLVLFDVDE